MIVTGFLGPNGSGTCTTMRMILGLDVPGGGVRQRHHPFVPGGDPRRSVFFGAKALVLGMFTLILGMVLSFLSFFVGQAVLSGGAPTATLGDPGVLRALVESGGFLALLALFGLGIGAIIRHSAGSIAVFVGCTLLVPLILHNVAGNPSRFMPVMLLGNSVGAVVPVFGALSSTAAFLLMALYAAIALAVGAAFLNRRDV